MILKPPRATAAAAGVSYIFFPRVNNDSYDEPQHLPEIIAELVGVKAAVDDYEPTFKMIPNELVTSYVEALVEKTIKSSYHDASKCVFVFKKAIWVGCVYPTKNVKFGIFS